MAKFIIFKVVVELVVLETVMIVVDIKVNLYISDLTLIQLVIVSTEVIIHLAVLTKCFSFYRDK